MPILKAEVDHELKVRCARRATVLGLSEAEYLRALVLRDMGAYEVNDGPVKPDSENASLERITVRVPRFLVPAIRQHGKAKGMVPSRWIAALVQSKLTGEPVMAEAELLALEQSNRELAAIGRNINQIARALNDAFYQTERVRLETLEELGRLIKENRSAVRALVCASQNAWGAA